MSPDDLNDVLSAYREALLEHGPDMGIKPKYVETLVAQLGARILGALK
jgi:hypothetical protein